MLLALALVYSLIARRWERDTLPGQLLAGLAFGVAAIIGMMTPLTLRPGLIFDGRSILISAAGLFGGGLPAAIAAVIAGVYRLSLGGSGTTMGLGVIVTSAALGVGYHYLLRKRHVDAFKTSHLLVLGYAVHIAMLLWTQTLPEEIRWETLRTIAVPVLTLYPAGEVLVGLLLISQDARQQAVEALRDSEARYRVLFEQANDGIHLANGDDEILDANPRLCKMMGYSREELLTMRIPDLQAPERRGRAGSVLKVETAHHGRATFEGLNLHRDGRRIPVEVSIGRVDTPEGERYISIVRDITRRKQDEQALRENEERYALAQRAAGIGSWDWDIETGTLHWSEQIESMFGFAPGEFGRTYEAFLESVHPDDRQRVMDAVNASVQQGAEYAIEHRLIWPDGTPRWVSEIGDVIRDKTGRAIRMLGVVQDITHRVQTAEELQQHRDRLEKLVAERTAELREVVNLMAGRELRMAELKEVIGRLRAQLEAAGLTPAADDPLAAWRDGES